MIEATQDERWSQLAGIHPGDRGAAAWFGRRLSMLPGRWRWSVERFLRWWLGELGQLLPLDAGKRPQPARLTIGEDRVLTANTRMPVDSLPMAEDLLALEVEELTPFSLDQVVAAYALQPAGGRDLAARLHVVPIRVLAESAERAGIDYDGIDEVELRGEGAPLRIALPRSGAAPTDYARAAQARRVRLGALAAAAVLLVAAALWLPQLLRRQAIAEESAALAAERAALQPALSRIGREQAVANAAQAAAAMKQQQPMMVDVLRRLTDLLGDEVNLGALRWEEGTLTLTGVAPDAAMLIGVLDADPMFDGVHLVAPVAVDRADGRQRFEMAMTVAARGR